MPIRSVRLWRLGRFGGKDTDHLQPKTVSTQPDPIYQSEQGLSEAQHRMIQLLIITLKQLYFAILIFRSRAHTTNSCALQWQLTHPTDSTQKSQKDQCCCATHIQLGIATQLCNVVPQSSQVCKFSGLTTAHNVAAPLDQWASVPKIWVSVLMRFFGLAEFFVVLLPFC